MMYWILNYYGLNHSAVYQVFKMSSTIDSCNINTGMHQLLKSMLLWKEIFCMKYFTYTQSLAFILKAGLLFVRGCSLLITPWVKNARPSLHQKLSIRFLKPYPLKKVKSEKLKTKSWSVKRLRLILNPIRLKKYFLL